MFRQLNVKHLKIATLFLKPDAYKKDIKIDKNYLHEGEIGELNRIVTMWLDFAEDQAKRKKQGFFCVIG